MKIIDLTLPLGIATPAWPTYEPLQIKYFKRLAPNGANGQLLTHSNHLGTHLDGECHFWTPGKDIASLDMDYLVHDAAVVDLSDCAGDYDVYTSKQVMERVEVKHGDILIIHTGYHHFGWDMPTGDEVRYMVQHPGPDREFAEWAKDLELRWIGVDCGSADHPMNTIIRNWMPRQAKQAEKFSKRNLARASKNSTPTTSISSCTLKCSITMCCMPNAWAAISTCCSIAASRSVSSPGVSWMVNPPSDAALPSLKMTNTRN